MGPCPVKAMITWMRGRPLRHTPAVACFVVSCVAAVLPSAALAQTLPASLSDLRSQLLVTRGDTVWVTYSLDGGLREEELKGELRDLTDTTITVGLVTLSEDAVRLVECCSDSLQPSMWLGGGIGAVYGAVAGSFGCSINRGGCAEQVLGSIAISFAIGAGIGMGIDALFSSRQPVFRNTTAAEPSAVLFPTLHRRGAGITVRVGSARCSPCSAQSLRTTATRPRASGYRSRWVRGSASVSIRWPPRERSSSSVARRRCGWDTGGARS